MARTVGIAGTLLALAGMAHTQQVSLTASPPRGATRLTLYANQDLALVREARRLFLPAGTTEVAFSWRKTAVDGTSVQLALPAGVRLLSAARPASQPDSIVWQLQADAAGEHEVLLRYFASGLRWRPFYQLVLDPATGEVRLDGLVDLTNDTGQEFGQTTLELVVGDLSLVANLARDALKALQADPNQEPPAPAAAGAGLSELETYQLPGRYDLRRQELVRVRFREPAVATGSLDYRLDEAKYGAGVHRFLVLRNTTDAGLGTTPLLGAETRVRSTQGEPLGTFTVPYTPVEEEAEMDLGVVREMLVERRVMGTRRTDLEYDRIGRVEGYDDHEDIEVEFRNRGQALVTLAYTDTIPGVWDIASAEAYEEQDANQVVFRVELQPDEVRTLAYRLLKRQGSRNRLGPTHPR